MIICSYLWLSLYGYLKPPNQPSKMKQALNEFSEFVIKNLTLILSIMAAGTVKVILDHRRKELSFWEKVAKFTLAVLIGWLTYNGLHNAGMERYEAWMPSIATITGESIITWVMEHSNRIMSNILVYFETMFKIKKDK